MRLQVRLEITPGGRPAVAGQPMPALPWLAPGPPARWLSEPEGKEHGLPTCQSQVLFLRSVQRVTLQCAAAAAPQKAHRQPGLEDSEPDWKRDID